MSTVKPAGWLVNALVAALGATACFGAGYLHGAASLVDQRTAGRVEALNTLTNNHCDGQVRDAAGKPWLLQAKHLWLSSDGAGQLLGWTCVYLPHRYADSPWRRDHGPDGKLLDKPGRRGA